MTFPARKKEGYSKEEMSVVDDLVSGGLRVVGAVFDHLALVHRELSLDVVLLVDQRLDERRVSLVGQLVTRRAVKRLL